MASSDQISELRRKVNEPTDANGYTDAILGDMVDLFGVDGAAAQVWSEKAAKAADLVDVTEAGATHRLGQMAENARKMAGHFSAEETGVRPVVKKIVRS